MVSETKVRLFPGGPEFPSEFLDFIQEGRVVFFCGAGLSAGTGLPTFPVLVRELDEILNPDPANRFDANRGDYDRMLSELESRFIPGRMRKHVRRILSKLPRDPEGVLSSDEVLENHRNILQLAAISGGGTRLVTTNFDNRFLRAAKLHRMSILHDDAPKLPVPEAPGWSSLVHLHGRICNGGNLNDLVLNSGDFGRAYLSEGWARRFVVRLMRHWPVAFVGYRLDDPPMRYLMDAVYDRRGDSKGFERAFALVGCAAGEENRQLPEWESKHVTPIFYDSANNHEALREALGNLVLLKDGPDYRAELAIQGVDKDPGDENGDNGRRVVWALRSPVAAKDFAEKKMFPKVEDGEKFVRWLDVFEEAGIFRADKIASADALNCPPYSLDGAPNLPPVANCLASWAARHVHQPELLKWLVSARRDLHPRFISQLHFFANKKGKMPEELAEKWNLYIQGQHMSPPCGLLPRDLAGSRDKSEWVKSNWGRMLLAALRPYPQVTLPSFQRKIEKQEWSGVKVNVSCELDRAGHQAYSARRHVKSKEFVMTHAEALSAHLEESASLMKRCGIDTFSLRCLRPEEDDHYTTPHWLFLTLRVRDAVLGMIERQEFPRLGNLVSGWLASEHLLPRRLALFTITEAANSPASASHLPVDWGAEMMIKRPDILWTLESVRESCRFLRKAGMKVSASLLGQLERVIRKGPPRSQYRNDITEEEVVKAMRYEVAKLLAKLELSGAQLSPESARMLAAARAAEPEKKFEEFMEYHSSKPVTTWGAGDLSAPGWVRGTKQATPKWAEMTTEECADCIQSAEPPNSYSLIKGHPDKAMDVFEILAERGAWNKSEWAQLLNNFDGNKDLPDKVAIQLLRWLESMPSKLVFALERNYTYAMKIISRTQPFSKMEKAWRLAWELGWDPSPSVFGDHVDALDIAINNPHGQLAEVPLMGFGWGEEREKLLDVLAEILASKKLAHKHGKIVIGSRLSPLFHNNPEWSRQHLLPFFALGHPMAFHMWDSFLYHPGVSVDLLAALKPGLMHFLKRVDDFHGRANNLVGIFVVGELLHPEIISRDEKRRIISGMSPKGIQHLCWHLERELWDGDGATLAKTWRERIFPFLREVWPEKRWSVGNASSVSRALAGVVTLTGNAFPEASKWAHDFLLPITENGRPMHPIADFLYGHQQAAENIPTKFPRECLLFLDRIVPDKEVSYKHELDTILDKIKEAKPELEKRPEFIRLRRIASGG